MDKTIVIALGGNALSPEAEAARFIEDLRAENDRLCGVLIEFNTATNGMGL